MSKIGESFSKFIGNSNAVKRAMNIPASEQTVDVKATSLGTEPIVKPKATPKQNLVPDPKTTGAITKKRRGRPKKFKTLAEVQADIDSRNPTYRSPVTGGLLPGTGPKVSALDKVGLGKDDVKDKVNKDIKDEFEIDPKMKKAFGEALALPAKSAAVALIDLLEKIPAPSKEASKILNRNISKITNSFKLGAASAEVANDEEDNDSKESGNKPSLIGALISKAVNFVTGRSSGGGDSGGGDAPQLSAAPSQPMLPGAAGDPSYGRRAPYTGTADGIGLGDGTEGSRAMQPIKKRKSMASKLFGMTPMGMAFNAGKGLLKGAKGLTGKMGKDGLGGMAKKAFGMTPMGLGLKLGMKAFGGVKNIFAPNTEQTTNLTELTDKTIKENRESADAKTQKQVDLAAGTGAAMANSAQSQPPYQQEGGELAQPNIQESPYIDVYNTTSQF